MELPAPAARHRLAEAAGAHLQESELFGSDYLIERPLLGRSGTPAPARGAAIDEVDRADEEFEAFLLELLAEGSITIPEIGTVRATLPPWRC